MIGRCLVLALVLAGPAQAEPGGAEPGRAEPGRANPDRADPGRADPGGANPGGANPGRANPGGINSGLIPSGEAVNLEASRFQRTVTALQESDEDLRNRFAALALLELAEIYLSEADLARGEARESDKSARLRGWSRAVEQYAEQLLLVHEDIELGFPVELRNYVHEVPSVTVAGRTVFLAHPRRSQQGAFEQSVLTRFCTGTTCTALTVENQYGDAPIPMSPGVVTPDWAFSETGPICRYRGLSVQFSLGGQLTRQRALCQELMQEAALLATELAWQGRHGVAVDWDKLQLRPTPQRPEHLAVLNGAGDSLLITLPLVYSTQGLLPRLVPWLQTYGVRQQSTELTLRARELGWE